MEPANNRDYKGGLGIPPGSTFETVADSESITGEAVIVSTPLGAVFHVRILKADDVPPSFVPPGGIRPVVNEKLAEIERAMNLMAAATGKMIRAYYHPQTFALEEILESVGLTLPGGA